MDEQPPPPTFVVMSIEEMRKKYYLPDERPVIEPLRPDNVPEGLRCLIPLAERWGINDDILRMDTRRRAAPEELAYLKSVVNHFDDQFDDWLAGPEADDSPPTREYLAFTTMRMVADGC
jgi:hypothetical protein